MTLAPNSPGKSTNGAKTVAATGAKRRGRPPGTKNAPKGSKGSSSGGRSRNPIGLRKLIFEVLDRDPKTYKKYIEDYPSGAVGLKVPEVRTIIEAEGNYKTTSSDIT